RILHSLGVSDICVFDRDKKLLDSLVAEIPSVKTVGSFEEGLKQKPDAVFILTPPKLHIPMAMEAIKNGCHVFCEKPISDSTELVGEFSELLAKSDRKFMVGLCFRYHEGIQKVKKLLDRGEIGRLISVRALMGEHLPSVRPDYKQLFSSKYSGSFDLMHDIDLALWFADRPVKNVFSVHGAYSDIGIEAPDVVELLLEFEGKCVATVHLDFFQRPRRRQMELIGTEGVMTIEFGSWDEYTISVYDVKKAKWDTSTEKTTRDDMFIKEDSAFLKAVSGDEAITCGLEEALKSLKVVQAAQDKCFQN
ncbi:MAG: Gfo/Idh/MocA family oxidoreductase, partial [Victivallales bacterium]